jgi:hypothetical protein
VDVGDVEVLEAVGVEVGELDVHRRVPVPDPRNELVHHVLHAGAGPVQEHRVLVVVVREEDVGEAVAVDVRNAGRVGIGGREVDPGGAAERAVGVLEEEVADPASPGGVAAGEVPADARVEAAQVDEVPDEHVEPPVLVEVEEVHGVGERGVAAEARGTVDEAGAGLGGLGRAGGRPLSNKGGRRRRRGSGPRAPASTRPFRSKS